jgi:glycosyltransferase involved in cell wall biosynthesis
MSTKKPISLSIFFPTYNEEANIEETVSRTVDVVESSPFVDEYEILIIDDGSKDQTREISERLERVYPNVRVIRHATNLGYGAALKSGMAAARMDYVFFTDADLQFDINELQNLLTHVGHYPVVIGYRAPRRDSFMRLVNAWGWNKLNRLLFGLRIRDIDCAFKLFKRSELQKIKLKSKGAMISAETLIRLTRRKVPLKEVPVSHLPRTAGSPTGAKPSVILRAFREMVELYNGDLGLVTQKEALRFMSVGVINTLLDILVYFLLTRNTFFFADHLTIAKFASFMAGTVSSLLLNRSWTFAVQKRISVAEVARFYTTTSLSIVVNVLAMNFLLALGMYDLLALGIVTVFTFGINFTLAKLWVFKKTPEAVNEPHYATSF